jgi:FtsH-binding integral membrane protein
MRTAIKVALATLLACGGLLLVLGIIIWTGVGDHEQLVAAHITIGVVLVLTLWTIAAIAARSAVPAGPVAFAAAWGLLVVFLGLAQEDLWTGSWHWTIQLVHVAVSMGAVWWGRRLVQLIGRARSASQPTLTHPLAMSAPRGR